MEPLLKVEELRVWYPVYGNFLQRLLGGGQKYVHAVDGVSFEIREREVLGLVGESGSGKTTIGRALLHLARPTSGRIVYAGEDVTRETRRARARVREEIQIIYQDPHAALNPSMTVGDALEEVLRYHGSRISKEADGSRRGRVQALRDEVLDQASKLLEQVGLQPPEQFLGKLPSELSGGQKQRVVIARAIAVRPRIIVADEPVALLDMSIRAKVLELLLGLRERLGMAVLLITHDLATAKLACDRIGIMYLGRLVEIGPAQAIYRDPKHPYTKALLSAVPVPDPRRAHERILPRGEVPDAVRPPAGCRFHPRCPVALPTCGWEGRDFLEVLDQRRLNPERIEAEEAAFGALDRWQAAGSEARGMIGRDPDTMKSNIGTALMEGPSPLGQAVESVRIDGEHVVVRFRPPEALAPKEVEGRLVECLLY